MKTAKRLCAALLALALIFTLAGCNAQTTEPTPTPTPAQSETPAPDAAQDAPATSAPSETERQEETPAAPPVEEQPGKRRATDASDALPTGELRRTGQLIQQTRCITGEHPRRRTVSISCATILENLDRLNAEKADLIPADGVLLAPTAVEFTEGESVFDVLKRVCRENKIHMEFSETPVYQSAYIEGIGNLYEFDCGEGSGWMYREREFPNYGCSRYTLADGDTVEWVYTATSARMSAEGSAHEASRLSRLPSGGEPSVLYWYLTFSMFFLHLCIAVSLCAALWCAAQLNGGAAVWRSARWLAPSALLAALVNLAFNHEGATILAYLPSGNPLTLESIAYGFAAAAMLAAVVLWFSCWNTVMTSDKLTHLFRARRARPLAPAVHDAALCAPLSGKAPGGDGGAAGHGAVRGKGPASKAQERRDGLFRYGDVES